VKIISILGSPRGMKGHTGSLVKCMLEAAENAGAETEIFSLSDLTVHPCKGCLEVCHINGACHQNDDFEKIKNAMLEADGIIDATPNYNLNVSAQMKAFIDRCGLLLHCQILRGKYVAMLVTSGGSDPEDVENYFRNILKLYGYWIVGSIGAVEMQFEDAEEKALEKLISETHWDEWDITRTSGRVNWVFKFRGGLGNSGREYLVWVNRTDGNFSKFERLE